MDENAGSTPARVTQFKLKEIKFYSISCYIIAFKNRIGKTLVTGHKSTYFKEAAHLTLKLNNYAILL